MLFGIFCQTCGCAESSSEQNAELFYAARTGDNGAIERLLNDGADVNCQEEKYGITPLATAAIFGNVDSMKLLLANGADPNLGDALGYVAESGRLDLVKLLLGAGADPNSARLSGVPHPLFGASSNGHAQVVRILLDSGSELGMEGDPDFSPLRWAVAKGHIEVVKELLARGYPRNLEDSDGKTVEDIARARGDREMMKLLEGTP